MSIRTDRWGSDSGKLEFTGCVTQGKLINLLLSQLLHPKNSANNNCDMWLSSGLNEITYAECSAQWPTHSKRSLNGGDCRRTPLPRQACGVPWLPRWLLQRRPDMQHLLIKTGWLQATSLHKPAPHKSVAQIQGHRSQG